MKVKSSQRARGSNRGGCGGGYERTDPDYQNHRLAKMRQEYLSLPSNWKEQYLGGLGKFDKAILLESIKENH